MKKLFGIFFTLLFLFSCEDEDRKELLSQPVAEKQPDSVQVLSGGFAYGTDSGIIRGEDFVYGVIKDSMANVLAEKVYPLRSDDFDMVPVKVRAEIMPNPMQNGLKEVIKIREILEVADKEIVSDSIKK